MPVRERSSKMRNLERNEDFRREIGLTPEGAAWEAAYRELKGLLSLRSTTDIACRQVLFYVARKSTSMSPRNWRPGTWVVPAELCRCVSLMPIPTHPAQCYWDVSEPPRRRFRMNFMVSRFRVDGDCELWVDSFNDKEWANRVIQRDAAKQPITDHPKFTCRSYDPYGGLQVRPDPTVKAPIAGKFTLESNELHVSLVIDGVPVYRFDPADVQDMVTHSTDPDLAKPGRVVRQGAPLIRMVSPAPEYAQVRWRDRRNGMPDMDVAKGDFLSGTREKPLVLMAAKMISQVANFAKGEEREDFSPFGHWAPRHLLAWDAAVLDKLISQTPVDDWRGMEEAVVDALGPQPDSVLATDRFCIRVTDFEEAAFKRIEERDGYDIAHFGEDEEVILPKSAVLLDTVKEGELFRKDDPIADFAPRTHYGWDQIVTLPQISYILRELAQALATYPGERGYRGSYSLFPSDLTPYNWERAKQVQGHYLDFQDASRYLKGNVVMGPPWNQAWAEGWQRHDRDIGYNFEPIGERFLANPMSFE